MKATLCPVCGGSGEAGDWLKGLPVTTKSICWGCNGRGWVEVNEYPSTSYPATLLPDPNRCPACGGDRNNPPLTGCPLGSHYGSYCEEVNNESK